MPGQPKRRAALAELLRLAREMFGDETPENDEIATLAYLEARIASGTTLLRVVDEVSNNLGQPIHRETIAKWMREAETRAGPEWDGWLTRARARGAHAIVEGALKDLEETPPTRDDIAKAKAVTDTRLWTAERWNREEFGQRQQGGINISIGQLHLDALRARPFVRPEEIADATATAIANAPLLLSAGGAGS